MCRNYLYKGKKKKPCRSWTLTLPKSVPTREVLKIVSETLEDGLKRKNLKLQRCREFFPVDLDIKFGPIGVRMLPETPKYRRLNLDDGNPRVYIKRGNLGQRAPRNFLPLGSRLEGEINLHSRTIFKEEEGGQGPLPPRAVAVGAAVAVSFISSGLH